MIIEELIVFDNDKLRPVKLLEDRLSLTRDFFDGLPPASNEKLELIINEIKKRQADEQPYLYRSFNHLLSAVLLVTLLGLGIVLFIKPLAVSLRSELQKAVMIMLPAWFILHLYSRYASKKQRYERLIQVLEYYYLARK